MGKLDTLKVAAFVLRDLKSDERVYKQELVKAASKKLYELHTGTPLVKYAVDSDASFWGKDIEDDPSASRYDRRGWLGRTINWWGRVGNSINRDWGKAAVDEYANSIKDPAERERYIRSRAVDRWGNDLGKTDQENIAIDRANRARDKSWQAAATHLDTVNKGIVDDTERELKREQTRWEATGNKIGDAQDRLYNNGGLYGGPGGLGPNVGGPQLHRPLMATNRFGWTIGGGGMWGPGARGGYGGYGYGRGYGYGGRGSVYARGGMGGYYGRGGYGGYGYGAPGAGTYPGMGPVMGGRATYAPGGPYATRTWGVPPGGR